MNGRSGRSEACAAVLTALWVAACGGRVEETDGGSARSTPAVVSEAACKRACPGDPEAPPSTVEACKRGEDPSGAGCDAQYVAALNCAAARVVCKDGKTDPTASANAVVASCAADLFGYQGCVLKSFDGGLPSLDAGR